LIGLCRLSLASLSVIDLPCSVTASYLCKNFLSTQSNNTVDKKWIQKNIQKTIKAKIFYFDICFQNGAFNFDQY